MSQASTLIGIIIKSIKSNDTQLLTKALKALPLESLDQYLDDLLSNFLSTAAGYNNPDTVPIILESWERVYPEEEQLSIISRLFLIRRINKPALAFVVLNNETFTYVQLMDDLMVADSSPNVAVACRIADEIFGEQPYETYVLIKDHAEEQGNTKVIEYATRKMEETAPYAEVPSWVNNPYPELPTQRDLDEIATDINSEITVKFPTDKEAVDLLTAETSMLGISNEEIEEMPIPISDTIDTLSLPDKPDNVWADKYVEGFKTLSMENGTEVDTNTLSKANMEEILSGLGIDANLEDLDTENAVRTFSVVSYNILKDNKAVAKKFFSAIDSMSSGKF